MITKIVSTQENEFIVSSLGSPPRRYLLARRLRGKTRKDHQKLTCKLSEPELAQSMAGIGVVVQHDKDGELPIVDLGSPDYSEVRQGQYREFIHGHQDVACHFSDPL